MLIVEAVDFSLSPEMFKNAYIEGAIIVDRHSKAERYFARHNHVKEFVDDFKRKYKDLSNSEIVFGDWPPVFTSNCPVMPGF